MIKNKGEMMNMKKLTALLTLATMLLCTACGNSDTGTGDNSISSAADNSGVSQAEDNSSSETDESSADNKDDSTADVEIGEWYDKPFADEQFKSYDADSDTQSIETETIDEDEAYYKEVGEEDIVVDEENGVKYAKNQLLISVFAETEKTEIEKIANEIDAKIVGFIELTGDYQIEFMENKSLEELENIADYINSYPFVMNVTLNFISDVIPADN